MIKLKKVKLSAKPVSLTSVFLTTLLAVSISLHPLQSSATSVRSSGSVYVIGPSDSVKIKYKKNQGTYVITNKNTHQKIIVPVHAPKNSNKSDKSSLQNKSNMIEMLVEFE